jgi:hypothetical protein
MRLSQRGSMLVAIIGKFQGTHHRPSIRKDGSPAILGTFVALERRGGSEDPWLCVSGFCQIYLCRKLSIVACSRQSILENTQKWRLYVPEAEVASRSLRGFSKGGYGSVAASQHHIRRTATCRH